MQRDAPNLILRLPSYCVQAVGVAGFGTGEDQSNEAA